MKINDRKGNGTYFRQYEVNDEEWFMNVAFKDVQMMHLFM
jgi:stalled ribosome alternative rescue factor ArfA